jgi:hypothetical protein
MELMFFAMQRPPSIPHYDGPGCISSLYSYSLAR